MSSAKVEARGVSAVRPETPATPATPSRAAARPALSIRLRLTVLYSAILALALSLFGGALYLKVAYITYDSASTTLVAEASNLIAARPTRGGFSLDPSIGTQSNTYIQIRDAATGSFLYQSSNLRALKAVLPLSTDEQQTLLQGEAVAPHEVAISGTEVLLYSTPVFSHFGPGAILQIARPLHDIYSGLDALRPVLLLGGLLITALAFAIGWLLAGTALRPIARITQTAQQIGDARDFGRRVAYSGPRDEVGRLATTFNTMLTGLQEAYQTQRRFVADASHELRTPLTSIRGNLGLLQRDPPIRPADQKAVLSDLVSESERLSRLVSDLLTLARSDVGRSLHHDRIVLAPLFDDLVRRLAASHPDRPIAVTGDIGAAVAGDRDALTQVLLILLDNALKFTPAPGTITLTTTVEKDKVAIAVDDDGPGIAPEALPRIFDRFFQSDVARASLGAGLGLSIAKALVEALQGSIAVESRPGLGSTFTVTLPRATS